MPIRHQCTRPVQDNSEGPSESSLLDDNTIGPSSHSSSPFPTLPQPMFILRPAVFDPEAPTLPLIPTEPIKTTLPVTKLPLIPQLDFLKPSSAQSKLPRRSTNSPIIPAIQVTAPSSSATVPIPKSAALSSVSLQTLPIPSTQISMLSPTPLMSNKNKGSLGMSGPGSKKVPSFNGETSKLLEFFDIFKDLALSHLLTDEQKCKMIVRYTDPFTKHFWVTLNGYETKDYGIFKQSILAKYPRAK
ncbi:hypothetical protein BDR03DRAFT_1016175 [Suillus americanus]|nr:hypothetical protein BDR03DRAFT_1016175 [Suillus americanus]